MHRPFSVEGPFAGATGLLAQVGDTPLVRLDDLLDLDGAVEVWGKAEWCNPGGSVKARAALSIVLDAERRGILAPGGTILDASSGNTGIAYAMVAAHRGYRLVLCLPSNANAERQAVLRAYGAVIEKTDPMEGTDGAIRRARELAAEHPDWVYLDQYANDGNWRAHYGSTGPEIWRDTGGRLTHFVATVGTSGTFVGTSRYLAEVAPHVVRVEVQPDGPFHGLEGVKHMETAMVPPIYDPSLATERVACRTEDAHDTVRRLARRGLLLGPSAGAAAFVARQVATSLASGVVVCILCDSGERYLSDRHLWEPR